MTTPDIIGDVASIVELTLCFAENANVNDEDDGVDSLASYLAHFSALINSDYLRIAAQFRITLCVRVCASACVRVCA